MISVEGWGHSGQCEPRDKSDGCQSPGSTTVSGPFQRIHAQGNVSLRKIKEHPAARGTVEGKWADIDTLSDLIHACPGMTAIGGAPQLHSGGPHAPIGSGEGPEDHPTDASIGKVDLVHNRVRDRPVRELRQMHDPLLPMYPAIMRHTEQDRPRPARGHRSFGHGPRGRSAHKVGHGVVGKSRGAPLGIERHSRRGHIVPFVASICSV